MSVLGISGNVYHVHHHWVTETGDTIFLNDAYLTTYPTPDPNNRVLADYLSGVQIIGGTGAFAGAKGESSVFGAVDLSLGQLAKGCALDIPHLSARTRCDGDRLSCRLSDQGSRP